MAGTSRLSSRFPVFYRCATGYWVNRDVSRKVLQEKLLDECNYRLDAHDVNLLPVSM